MPTKAPADSAQAGAQVGGHRRHHEPAADRGGVGAHRVPRAHRHRPRRRCGPRCVRPTPTTRSTRTRWPAGPRPTPGFTEMAELLEGPVAIAFVRPDGDAVTAAKALRDFAKTNPNLVVKGGMFGPTVAERRRRRGARRGAAPRGAARPARRWVPGAAREGGRPVPGVHPQLRLRPQGVHRHAARRGRRRSGRRRAAAAPRTQPEAEDAAGRETRRRSRRPRPRQRPSRKRQKHETEATTGEAN